MTESGYRTRLYAWLGLVGLISALGYVGRFSGGKPPKNALYHWSTTANELGLFLFIGLVVFGLVYRTPARELLALRPPDSWRHALGLMVIAFFVVGAVNRVVDPFLHPGREQGIAPSGWQPGHAAAFAANFVVFAFIGPIVEELTFRGIGFKLLARHGRLFAVVLTGLLFGVWHGLVEALPVLVTFGWLLGWIRERTHSVYPCIALHSFFNGIALILAVTT